MRFNTEKYLNLLSPETRLMCDMVSPAFDPLQFDFEKQLSHLKPELLLDTLKNHRLYTHFYKVWVNTATSFPGPAWEQFSNGLKLEVDRNRIQMLQKTTILVDLAKTFEKTKIPVIALKGPALAQRLYNDVAMKASVDLDILVHKDDLDESLKILESLGYTNTTFNHPLTMRQAKYTREKFQHFTYNTPNPGCKLEIHWRSANLEHLTNLSGSDFWMQPLSEVLIGNVPIAILRPELEFLYLAAHGTEHSFRRLHWLYDVMTFKEKYPEHLRNIDPTLFNDNKPMIDTSLACASLVFSKKQNLTEYARPSYMKHFVHTIRNTKDYSGIKKNINENYSRFLMIKGFRKKIRILSVQGTSARDWKTLPLPDSLFFLYFVLRPFLYVYRKIKDNFRKYKY